METTWYIIKTVLLGFVLILSFLAIITINGILLWIATTKFNTGLNPSFKPQTLFWVIPCSAGIFLVDVVYYEVIRYIYWDN